HKLAGAPRRATRRRSEPRAALSAVRGSELQRSASAPGTLRRARSPAIAVGHGQTAYSTASDNVVLFGAGKPGSRPHHCASTTVPGVESAGDGAPPSNPRAKVFMSIVNTPLQSFTGGAVPPELTEGVRLIGVFVHSVPPWYTVAERPLVE